MNENNLISTCYLVETKSSGFISATLFLHKPPTDQHSEKLHQFEHVFEAKNFFREKMGYGVVLEVSKVRFENEVPEYMTMPAFIE